MMDDDDDDDRTHNDIDRLIDARTPKLANNILLMIAGAFLVLPLLFFVDIEQGDYLRDIAPTPSCIQQGQVYVHDNVSYNSSGSWVLNVQLSKLEKELKMVNEAYMKSLRSELHDLVATQSGVDRLWSVSKNADGVWAKGMKSMPLTLKERIEPAVVSPGYFVSTEGHTVYYRTLAPLGMPTIDLVPMDGVTSLLDSVMSLVNEIQEAIVNEMGGTQFEDIFFTSGGKSAFSCVIDSTCDRYLVRSILDAIAYDKRGVWRPHPHRFTLVSAGESAASVFLNETHVHVAQQLLAPVFSKLGVQTATRDISMYNIKDQLSCWSSYVGDDVDIVSYTDANMFASGEVLHSQVLKVLLESKRSAFGLLWYGKSVKNSAFSVPMRFAGQVGVAQAPVIPQEEWPCDLVTRRSYLTELKCDCITNRVAQKQCKDGKFGVESLPLDKWLSAPKPADPTACWKSNTRMKVVERVRGARLAWFVLNAVRTAVKEYQARLLSGGTSGLLSWPTLLTPQATNRTRVSDVKLNGIEATALCGGRVPSVIETCLQSQSTCYTMDRMSRHHILDLVEPSGSVSTEMYIPPGTDQARSDARNCGNKIPPSPVTLRITPCKESWCFTVNLPKFDMSQNKLIVHSIPPDPKQKGQQPVTPLEVPWYINNDRVTAEKYDDRTYKIPLPTTGIFGNCSLRVKWPIESGKNEKKYVLLSHIVFKQSEGRVVHNQGESKPAENEKPVKDNGSNNTGTDTLEETYDYTKKETPSDRKWLYANIDKQKFNWLNKTVAPIFDGVHAHGVQYAVDEYSYTVRVVKPSVLSATRAAKAGDKKVLEEIKRASKKITDLMTKMDNEYGGKHPLYSGKNEICDTPNCWDNLVAHLLTKILWDQPTDRFRIPHQYKIAMTGHSAGAGHGNYGRDAYSMVFGHLFGEGLASVGVRIAMRNFCSGGTNSLPVPDFCFEGMVGPDVDWVGWDHDMTEAGRHIPYDALFLRGVRALPSQPPLVLFVNHRPPDGKKYSVDTYQMKGSVPEVNTGKTLPSCDERPKYPWLNTLDCSVCKTLNFSKSEKECKEMQYSPYVEWTYEHDNPLGNILPYYRVKIPMVGHSCVGRAYWHPTWALHRLRGVYLAYIHLTALKEALARLRKQVQDSGAESLPQWSDAKPSPRETRDFMAEDVGHELCPNKICELISRMECRTQPEPRAHDGLEQLLKNPVPRLDMDNGMLGAFNKEWSAPCNQFSADVKWAMYLRSDSPWAEYKIDNLRIDGPSVILLGEPAVGWKRPPEMVRPNDVTKVRMMLDKNVVIPELLLDQRSASVYMIRVNRTVTTSTSVTLRMNVNDKLPKNLYLAIGTIVWVKDKV